MGLYIQLLWGLFQYLSLIYQSISVAGRLRDRIRKSRNMFSNFQCKEIDWILIETSWNNDLWMVFFRITKGLCGDLSNNKNGISPATARISYGDLTDNRAYKSKTVMCWLGWQKTCGTMTRNDLQFNATCVLSENRLPRNYPRVNHFFKKIAINWGKNIEDLGQLYLYSEGLKHVETSSHYARSPRTQRTISCSGEPWFTDGNHAARSSQWQSNLENAPCLSTCS